MKLLFHKLSKKNSHKRNKVLVASVLVAFLASTGMFLYHPAVAKTTKPKTKIRESRFYYNAFNKRDPFASLIVGGFISEKKMTPLDLSRALLVGVIKGELDRFALLEDDNGFSYILRVGDRIKNGSIVAVGDESIVARVTTFGQTTKLTLRLDRRGEGDRK